MGRRDDETSDDGNNINEKTINAPEDANN